MFSLRRFATHQPYERFNRVAASVLIASFLIPFSVLTLSLFDNEYRFLTVIPSFAYVLAPFVLVIASRGKYARWLPWLFASGVAGVMGHWLGMRIQMSTCFHHDSMIVRSPAICECLYWWVGATNAGLTQVALYLGVAVTTQAGYSLSRFRKRRASD